MEGDYDRLNMDMSDELSFDVNDPSFPLPELQPPEEGGGGGAVVTPDPPQPLLPDAVESHQEEEETECPHFIEVHTLSNNGSDYPEDHLDSALSDALNQLTIGEREKVFHDVHGIPSDEITKESPDFLNEKLHEFQEQLDKIMLQSTSSDRGRLTTKAIRMAMEMEAASSSTTKISPDGYVSNRKFRIAFLRTEDYHPRQAVERFIRFFDLKLELFGPDKLCKNITYDDLGNDSTYLSKGVVQVLPVADRAGRPIFVFFPSQQEYSKVGSGWTNICGRMYFYLWSSIMDGEALQKKGAVFMLYNVGPLILQEFDPGIPPFFFNAVRSFPFKFVGCHICFNSKLFRPVAQNVVFTMNNTSFPRASCKLHEGSQQEVFYALMTYGIPTDCIPVNFDNDIKKINHQEMLAMAQKKEEYLYNQCDPNNIDDTVEFVIIPDNLDVLFGKGTTYHSRPGNMRLKLLIDDLLPHQSSLQSRSEKVKLVQQVVDTVKAGGGRFLSKESGVWMSVQDDAARKKVADLFRNRRKIFNKAAAASANTTNASISSSSPSSKKYVLFDVGSSSSMMFVNGAGGGSGGGAATSDSKTRPSFFGFGGDGPPGKRLKHGTRA